MTDPSSVATTVIDGDGEPVLFLHGLFGQGKNFTSIAKALAPRHRSVLVDLPNHGASQWTEHVDYGQMAEAVAGVIREQADGRAAVVGHSMGGKVAMVLALRHPDLVERLAVVDISPVVSAESSEFEHLLDSLLALDLSTLASRSQADNQLTDRIRSRTVRGFLLQNLTHREGRWEWKANLDLLRAELGSIGSFPDGLDKHPYDGPVLWVAGANSDYVRDEYADTMRELFPLVRKVVVKDAGHWVHSEQAQVFTEIIRRFLDS
ncbi:alpha/beta fold hydrolase [Blastococcus sp. Marseille-P5729]|uniref:alpha/beta fold hydrolase n=1 Tax=Blastococcus sp. Marseille-P5729 TaxID=2086582 RepID=UPI001F2A1DE8|nr:alpha/beta fold hydrolase [Blastococcus sp. Marseille-P5729]